MRMIALLKTRRKTKPQHLPYKNVIAALLQENYGRLIAPRSATNYRKVELRQKSKQAECWMEHGIILATLRHDEEKAGGQKIGKTGERR